MENNLQSREYLLKVAKTRMPFGKYKGYLLIDLPEPYLAWYHQKGFPSGQIGAMLHLMYEVKLNGIEDLIRNINKF